MNAALVQNFEQPPVYGTFADPVAAGDETLITVSAAALSQLVASQAAGKHYSSRTVLPFVPGVDGVGRLPDGRRVYFAFPDPPYGSMAQLVAVKNTNWVSLPDELDDVTAAAIANPGMSSWAGLTRRAHFAAGETVLINGATGAAGRLAIQIARHLGAKRVIATGRNAASLEPLTALGADSLIPLEVAPEQLKTAFQEALAGGVDVVLDYLWGASAEAFMAAAAGSGSSAGEPRIRYVQIGSLSGNSIALPGGALRSSGLELMGSGLGSVSYAELLASIGELMAAVLPAKLIIAAEAASLTDVATAWAEGTKGKRLVFTL